MTTQSSVITYRTFARVGLFGNPSDQYGGRTIAFSLMNFYAEVTLTPSDGATRAVRIQPHPVFDSTGYDSLQDLVARTSSEGLYGGVRLLTATCKRFAEYCLQHGIILQRDPGEEDEEEEDGSRQASRNSGGAGFTLSYDTTVPRQTGMAGSSAIILSAFKCLMEFFGVGEDRIPHSALPGLVLSVESAELGIAAGLQDRVVQVYGGLVHMDFDPVYMAQHGGVGCYSRLDAGLLPRPLYVMYSQNPSESGKVHSGVKAKWHAGDPQVRALMSEVARCGDRGLQLLLSRPAEPRGCSASIDGTPNDSVKHRRMETRDEQLAALMTENFELRRALFGDEVLGARNIRMVELARSAGAGVNFTGSGGAVIVFCPGGEAQAAALRAAAEAEGFTMAPALVGPETAYLPPPPPQ